jgi:hypothetical protein
MSAVPVVLLGAAVSLGVIAVTASRFSWRRPKTEPAMEPARDPKKSEPQSPRDPDAPRWDSPPPELQPPSPADDDDPP